MKKHTKVKLILLGVVGGTFITLSSTLPKDTPIPREYSVKEHVMMYKPKLESQNQEILKLKQEIKEYDNALEDVNQMLAYTVSVDNVILTSRIDKDIQLYTYAMCLEYNVDYKLAISVMLAESGGKVKATNSNRNGTKDSGLMQINSINHKWLSTELGVSDFFNPYENVKSGIFILSELGKKYDNYHKILTSYNMGEPRMREIWEDGGKSSSYSRKIMEIYGGL